MDCQLIKAIFVDLFKILWKLPLLLDATELNVQTKPRSPFSARKGHLFPQKSMIVSETLFSILCNTMLSLQIPYLLT
jgi:hypothetical protein